jgi:transmembrane sensor
MQPSEEALAEAAAWLARLHRPRRTPQDDAGFRRWLEEEPSHGRAWAMASDMWENANRLSLNVAAAVPPAARSRLRVWYAAAASVVVAILIVAAISQRNPIISTAVGEQRVMTLQDGTRLSLNTNTRVQVKMTRDVRNVTLLSGEALFEVAKRPAWPFVVEAGTRTVTALGTAFVVRKEEQRVAVTLVEGKIAIDDLQRERPASAPLATLQPGERMIFAADRKPQRDKPPLDSIVAWQRGQAVFDNIRLVDAIAEMNRYNGVMPLAVADPAMDDLPVSGIFRLGDSASFARAVAFTYGLEVVEDSTRIVLTGTHATAGDEKSGAASKQE